MVLQPSRNAWKLVALFLFSFHAQAQTMVFKDGLEVANDGTGLVMIDPDGVDDGRTQVVMDEDGQPQGFAGLASLQFQCRRQPGLVYCCQSGSRQGHSQSPGAG